MVTRTRRGAAGIDITTLGNNPAIGSDGGNGDPSGSDRIAGGGPILIDPATVLEPGDDTGGNNGSATGEPRKRGRKPGSTNRPRGPQASLSVTGLETLLLALHQMGAVLTKTPELELDKSEANMLAQNTANVLAHYPSVKMPAQMVDWAALMMVMGTVYGPRIIAIRNNRQAERLPPVADIRKASGAAMRESTATAAAPPQQQANGTGPILVSEIPGLPGVKINRGPLQ